MHHLLGFDADGYLVVTDLVGYVGFVDVDGGRGSGDVVGLVDLRPFAPGAATTSTRGSDGDKPIEFPLTGQAWFDQVCAATGARAYTPTELALLPAGTSPDPPCS